MATVTSDLSAVVQDLGLDKQNQATLGRIMLHGGLGHAKEEADGRMRATVRIPVDELRWEPSITVMPHAGDLELELVNDDENTHCALVPSNGDRQFIWLPVHSRGRAFINLDGPGYY